MNDKKIIFFDWDGTLCSKLISQNANLKRTKFFESNLNDDEIINAMHNNNNNHYEHVQETIVKKTGVNDQTTTKVLQVSFFTYFYFEILNDIGEKSLLFDVENFKKFKEENNLKFVIVTSLYEKNITGSLEILGLRNFFDGVFGSTIDLSRTKLDNLNLAIKKIKGIPLAMVGDRGEDIESGKINNLKTIFCDYGHGDVSNSDIKIEEPEELQNAIKSLL